MLSFNVPLSQWEQYQPRNYGAGFFSSKNTDKAAKLIFSQLSHDKAVALVAKEFELLPPDLRMRLRTLCNEGNGSGNVRKGIQRLDKLLDGKLMREEAFRQKMNIRVEGVEARFRSKTVNPAIAGATRKYGILK
jgi:hypothetical protein